jgi:hypothetical protein
VSDTPPSASASASPLVGVLLPLLHALFLYIGLSLSLSVAVCVCVCVYNSA